MKVIVNMGMYTYIRVLLVGGQTHDLLGRVLSRHGRHHVRHRAPSPLFFIIMIHQISPQDAWDM